MLDGFPFGVNFGTQLERAPTKKEHAHRPTRYKLGRSKSRVQPILIHNPTEKPLITRGVLV